MSNDSTMPTRGVRLPRHERRSQLLEAALDVFVKQGYHAAAMDDIADRAAVSKPVLYQHFPGKLDLYLALLDRACESMLAAIDRALESTDDNKLRVQATVEAFFDYVASDEGGYRLVFESDLTNEPVVRERVDKATHRAAELVAAVIADDTGLPAAQAHLLAVAMVGMAQVSSRWWLDEQGDISRQDAAVLVAALAWRGIGGYPRSDDR